MSQIPKTLHFVWVGDESLRPDAYIETWRRLHPEFELRIWGNKEWQSLPWKNRRHMDEIARRNGQYAGVADLMRWEILLEEGGFALDADSVCIRKLPDWLFDCDLFAAWENEYAVPGLVANGYVGAKPGHDVIHSLVQRFSQCRDLTRRFVWYKLKHKGLTAWKTTGPVPFTEELQRAHRKSATILPSHFFLPRHHSGVNYSGCGPIYSCELFAGAHEPVYENMRQTGPDQLVASVRRELGLEVD